MKVRRNSLNLATVISADGIQKIDSDWLKAYWADIQKTDDVLSKEFFNRSFFVGVNDLKIAPDTLTLLKEWGKQGIKSLQIDIAAGPYVHIENSLWQVMRLYDDVQGAFLIPTRPSTETRGAFEVLNDGRHGWSRCSLAVPSRTASRPSAEQPFAGYRFAMKDALDVKGLRTSMCNRAYLELYPAASQTARAISNIIHKGACIVGKTKLSSFLSREEATESID